MSPGDDAAPEDGGGRKAGRDASRRRGGRPRPRLPEPPWYAGGLRFQCTACGKCCVNHGDGYEYVFSSREERKALAAHFGLSLEAFERRYCERIDGVGLSFKSRDGGCIFLAGQRCSVYPLRPRQCRTFPFWPELLESEDSWQRDVASFCPGVGQGPLLDLNAIRAALERETDPPS